MKEKKKIDSGHRFKVDFTFREKLESVPEGYRHNFCYQCGACVGDCPAALYSDDFSPRLIVLQALLGFEDELLRPDSVIWNCTNCYTCAERCPQDVRPVDVIIALKNMCVQRGQAPPLIRNVSDAVLESGITTRITSLTEKRRQEFGLTPLSEYPIADLEKILEDD